MSKIITDSIASRLSTGRENGIHLAELAAMFETDPRTIRRQIETERRKGAAICSNVTDGYYLPESERDIAEFVRSMQQRAAEILQTAEAVENLYNYQSNFKAKGKKQS